MTAWTIISGEYPPQPGGVSDYTRQVARGLSNAGDNVSVWSSPAEAMEEPLDGVRVNRLPDHFGRRGLAILNRELRANPNARVLIEYVPHAFGMKAMNIPLCLLILRHRQNDITVMFHEVAYPVGLDRPLHHNALGVVNRAMATILARAASRMFVAAEAWQLELSHYAPTGGIIRWLPVPSNIPVADKRAILEQRARRTAPGTTLVGHFGTYGSLVAERLIPVLTSLLSARTDIRILLIGRNSERFRERFVQQHRSLADRVMATGTLVAADVAACIGACDLMIQPYPDGITSRNTSALAGLEHGKATATTAGRFSEDFWSTSGAVMLAPDRDADALARCAIELIDNRDRAHAMGCAAIKLYRDVFDLRHTISALRMP